MVEVPSARAASSRARWEMDLSPGHREGAREPAPRPVTSLGLDRSGWLGHRLGPTGVLVAR